MSGFVRQDVANEINNGNIINADPLDAEFNALAAAFVATSGHRHNGLAGEGAPITVFGPSQNVVVSATDVLPKTTSVLDFGSTTLKFKDGFFSGDLTATAFRGNLVSNGISYADRILATAGGTLPAYSFRDNPTKGYHFYDGTSTFAFIIDGNNKFLVTPTEIQAPTGMNFKGNGSGLTNIPGAAIIGDVPAGGVAGNYPQLTGTGALTSGSITPGFGNINIGNNTFTGKGSGLTNLSASDLSGGTLPNGRLSGDYTFANLTLSATMQAVRVRVNDGTAEFPTLGFKDDVNTGFFRDAASSIGASTNGTQKLRIANDIVAMGGASFSGSGSALTALNADNISTGTLGSPRLPATGGGTTWVGGRIADMALGDIGAYCFLAQASATTSNITAGTTYNASNLRYAGFYGSGNTQTTDSLGAQPPGTNWMACGTVTTATNTIRSTLFRRIT